MEVAIENNLKNGMSAKDYVSRNCIALFDAIENAEWRKHDTNIELWVDLTKHIALEKHPFGYNRFEFTSNSLCKKREYYEIAAPGYATIANVDFLKSAVTTGCTVEVVGSPVDFLPQYMQQTVYSNASQLGMFIHYSVNVEIQVRPFRCSTMCKFSAVGDIRSITLTTSYSNGIAKADLYVNGQFCKTFGNLTTDLDGDSITLLAGDNNTHRIAIYNRKLDANEILHNYAVDKERFGI